MNTDSRNMERKIVNNNYLSQEPDIQQNNYNMTYAQMLDQQEKLMAESRKQDPMQ